MTQDEKKKFKRSRLGLSWAVIFVIVCAVFVIFFRIEPFTANSWTIVLIVLFIIVGIAIIVLQLDVHGKAAIIIGDDGITGRFANSLFLSFIPSLYERKTIRWEEIEELKLVLLLPWIMLIPMCYRILRVTYKSNHRKRAYSFDSGLLSSKREFVESLRKHSVQKGFRFKS